MVAAAHLKPINDRDKRTADVGGAPSRGFVLAPDGSRVAADDPAARAARSAAAGTSAGALAAPAGAAEFQRDWRRHCPSPSDRWAFLQLCTPEALPGIFRVEANAPLLSEILVALDAGTEGGGDGAVGFALACMEGLTRAGRFALNARLLSRAGREAAGRVAGRGAASGDAGARARAAEVAAAYGVDPTPAPAPAAAGQQ